MSLIFFGECWVLVGAPRTVAVGERAVQDVVTPVPLIVIDPDRTDRIRLQEAQRIPPILRAQPEAVAQAEAELQLSFFTNRQNFLDALGLAFQRTNVTQPEVNTPRFRRLVTSFQRQARPFPVTMELAELWAHGETDESIEGELICKLRQAMGHYIRRDELPAEARSAPAQWRLLASNSLDFFPDVEAALKATQLIHRTNVWTLSRARKDLMATFSATEQPTARFVAGLIRENCIIDAEATRRLRASKTNDLWAADHYAAGQVIVKAGDVISARAKAAIDKLEEKLAADRAQIDLVHALGKAQASMSSLKKETESARRRLWWLSLLGIPAVAAGLAVWRLRARPSEDASFALKEIGPPNDSTAETLAMVPHEPLPLVVHSWRTRAVAAERRVQKLTYALRAHLAPHLARWVAQKFVQQLLSNRKQLLQIQQQAEAEIAELERRLSEMQAPLQQRLRAYENRIVQLEEQLLAKDIQNRELVQFAIASTRKKLEKERGLVVEWD